MSNIVMYVGSLLSVLVVIRMLIKKVDIKITLFAVGIVLMYIGTLMGNSVGIEGGNQFIDPFMFVVEQFKKTLSSAGLVILVLGGYSAYMSKIGANDATVEALTKPLKKIKSPYILVPIIFLMGNLLSLVIPSASNLAIILLATLYPVMKKSGMSTLTSAAVIATTATVMPTPLGADNVAVAHELGMSAADYVFQYHAMISIPTLFVMAGAHYFWQKFSDKKAGEQLVTDEVEINPDKEVSSDLKGFQKIIYGLLPLLPILILLGVFFINMVAGTNINMSVEVVTILSLVLAIIIEVLYNFNDSAGTIKKTEGFFTGMGNSMGIVALLVAASVFVKGLTTLGIVDHIQNTMQNMSGSGVMLPILMVLLTALIVILSGSGTALFFAMIPLIVPLANAANIEPQALAVPLGLAGNLLRAVSPVAAVVVIVSASTKTNPLDIVKRTAVPMITGVIFMMILSLIMF